MKKLLIIVCAIIIILSATVLWLADIPNWVSLDTDRILSSDAASVMLDANGEEAALLSGVRKRVILRSEEIPDIVKHAFISAEDTRFLKHRGIDVRRIFGALVNDIRTMSLKEGASTITQQLVKLTHLTGEKKLSRKLNEAYLALRLERVMSKDEILTAYLNTVYFGSGAYGIESASRAYFGKNASSLDISEAALLAGIIKAPSRYSPFASPDSALVRRDYVIDKMLEENYISEDEATEAKKAALPQETNSENAIAFGWYRDAVIDECVSLFKISADDLLTGGYTVYTCLNPDMQLYAEKLFENGANFPDPASDGTPAQAAFCAVDAVTGAVRAVIGGRSYSVARGLNRTTQSRRQPGSAFKPISVYASAIDAYGLSPSSIIDDVKRVYDGGYSPNNAGGKFYGSVTLRTALSKSLNAATVSLIDFTGINSARDYAMRAGIPLDKSDNGLALALGSLTYGVTPLELACAYAPLANGGNSAQGHTVEKIVDRNGRIVYEHAYRQNRVMKSSSAYLITDMLKTAAESGSASALSQAGMPLAGKTGTASISENGNRDIWTVAYNPDLICVSWMGFDETDDEHQIPSWAGGSSYPSQLLAKFFSEIGSGADFQIPNSVTTVSLDKSALETEYHALRAPDYAPKELTISEVFDKEHMPSHYSNAFEAPEKLKTLNAEIMPSGSSRIWFTIQSANADYLIVRKANGKSEVIATASGRAGDVFEYIDEFDAEVCEYTVVARNRTLYLAGKTVLSEESDSVTLFRRKNLLEQIQDLFIAR